MHKLIALLFGYGLKVGPLESAPIGYDVELPLTAGFSFMAGCTRSYSLYASMTRFLLTAIAIVAAGAAFYCIE
jgi:hypothetical protein